MVLRTIGLSTPSVLWGAGVLGNLARDSALARKMEEI